MNSGKAIKSVDQGNNDHGDDDNKNPTYNYDGVIIIAQKRR